MASAGRPVSALCWAHGDSRLFVAAAHHLHTFVVEPAGPTALRLLAALAVRDRLRALRGRGLGEAHCPSVEPGAALARLPLPPALQQEVRAAYHHTVQGLLPEPGRLREFVLLPPSQRLYCTVRREGDEATGHYTLCLEFLGGLMPLLLAKRASKLRPEFVIYDPKLPQFESVQLFQLDDEAQPQGQKHGQWDNTDGLDQLLYSDKMPQVRLTHKLLWQSRSFRTADSCRRTSWCLSHRIFGARASAF